MSDIEMDELRTLFLEECIENIDALETGLLSMRGGDFDRDTLDLVFRAAHSIKGGGATFGFTALSSLTHKMEAYLDALREGTLQVSDQALQTLFDGVDVLREMLASTDPQDHEAHGEKDRLHEELDALLGLSEADVAESAPEQSPAGPTSWLITFKPNSDMATRGNDPYLILRELSTLGDCRASAEFAERPDWSSYDEKALYLVFRIELTTAEPESSIREVFEWVEFDCELSIEAQSKEINERDSNPASDPAEPENAESQPAAAAKPAKKAAGKSAQGDGSMRIATEKIDRILDLVGELVITQSIVSSAAANAEDGERAEQLASSLEQLERNTRELQDSVMRVRMLPIQFAFSRLPRIVFDLCARLGKQVDLEVEGESTELDKTVLDNLIDPLVHLTRNALDHGLETPEERLQAGKPETGRITLSAYHQSGSIYIKIRDDGRGIDTERVLEKARDKGVIGRDEVLSEQAAAQLIFAAGFSTADQVSDISGRGVGMDVVRRNIVELGGNVTVSTQRGQGTEVTIQLPLTLAILDGQLIKVGDQRFVVPILNINETLELRKAKVSEIPGVGAMAEFRDLCVPLVFLSEHLQVDAATIADASKQLVLVVDVHDQQIGLVIDAVLGQQQVVIKSLEDNFRQVHAVSGASIMTDGSVALILDTAAFAANQPTQQVA